MFIWLYSWWSFCSRQHNFVEWGKVCGLITWFYRLASLLCESRIQSNLCFFEYLGNPEKLILFLRQCFLATISICIVVLVMGLKLFATALELQQIIKCLVSQSLVSGAECSIYIYCYWVSQQSFTIIWIYNGHCFLLCFNAAWCSMITNRVAKATKASVVFL